MSDHEAQPEGQESERGKGPAMTRGRLTGGDGGEHSGLHVGKTLRWGVVWGHQEQIEVTLGVGRCPAARRREGYRHLYGPAAGGG